MNDGERGSSGAEVFGRPTARERRLLLGAAGVVVSLALIVSSSRMCGARAVAMWRGERDLQGNWLYREPFEADSGRLDAIDLEAVHRVLLPAWAVATPHAARRPDWEREAWDDLRSAVERNRNLVWILEELRRIILEGDVVAEAERLRYLTWLWSSYLDRHGQRWWVQSGVGVRPSGESFFYLVAYRTLADVDLDVNGEARRVRVVARVDRVNLRERHLGRVSRFEDGAVVVADRLREFALDAVWPLLGGVPPEGAETVEVVFSEAVASEAAAGLSPEAREVLVRTAEDRRAIVGAVESIGEREWCSGFSLRAVPVSGYSPSRLTRLAWLSIRSEGRWCPRVKLEEVEELVERSRRLREEEALEPAVEELLAWLARTVAVHEGRHVADEASGGAAPECDRCGPPAVTAEISAYLASLAWGPAPATAAYQACRAVRYRRNPHAAAMEAIQGMLGEVCFDGPPRDLARRARDVEVALFGRSEPIAVPADFPVRLALPERGGFTGRGPVTAAAR